MKITGTFVPIASLPRALLDQKLDWNVDALLRAVEHGTRPEAPALGVELRDVTNSIVGCAILIVDPIFEHVYVGALIIDERVRGKMTLWSAFSVVQEMGFELARTYHMPKIRWGTSHPRAMTRLVRDREVRRVETLVEVDVEEAA